MIILIIKQREAQNKQSFAQMTRYPTMACKTANSFSSSAWPTLEQPSSTNLAQQLSQPTNNWLSTAKLGPVLGRSTKVQAPPTPWSKNSIADYEYEDAEDAEYMPAPGFKESFFSAIDNSLKLIDESMMNLFFIFITLNQTAYSKFQPFLKYKIFGVS